MHISYLFQGNVENWLDELLKTSRQSVHGVIRSASLTIADPQFKLLEFENMFPAQVNFFSNDVNKLYNIVINIILFGS